MPSDHLARRILADDSSKVSVTTGVVMESFDYSGQPVVRVDVDGDGSVREMLATSTMVVGTVAVIINDGHGFSIAIGSVDQYLDGQGGSALPPGGLKGDVLAKRSDLDGDTRWAAPSSGDGGGSGGGGQGRKLVEGYEKARNKWPVADIPGEGYIPANADRLSLMIQNLSGTSIWIGGTNEVGDPFDDGVGSGVIVRWGASITLNASPAAAVYIWCPYDRGPVSWLAEEV